MTEPAPSPTAAAAGTSEPRSPRRSYWPLLAVAALLLAGATLAGLIVWQQRGPAADRQRGLDLVREGGFAEAEPLLLQALEQDPRDLEVVRALVQSQRKIGKLYTEAEPVVSRWCELEPDNPEPLRLRLFMWQRMHRRDRALPDALRLLELEPDNGAVRKQAVQLLLESSRFDEAERECRRCLEAKPNDPDLRFLLAKIHHVQGQTAETTAILDPLLRDQPAHSQALLLRGTLYVEAGQDQQAIPLLQRVLAGKPEPRDRLKARAQLFQALARTGQTKEAEAVGAQLQRDLQIDRLVKDSNQQPDNLDLKVRAAEGLLEEGDVEGGMRRLQQVLSRDPTNRAAHRVLAAHHERQGDAGLAKQHLQLAQPENP